MNFEGLQLPQRDQVFQRNERNVATIPITSREPVQAQLRAGQKIVRSWQTVNGGLQGVPVGGPYTLEVKTKSGRQVKVDGLLVGDLWVLAGQSNMDGYGRLYDAEPPSRYVHCFYYTEKWGIAKEPLCRVFDSIDSVHRALFALSDAEYEKLRNDDRTWREIGSGLGIRFAKEVHKATGVPVGLIMCSHGGTSMEQWSPEKKDLVGASLYGGLVRRVSVCGGRVAGVLWYQGESDASEEAAPLYKDRMKRFVAALRADLGAPRLPIIFAQLSRFFVDENVFPAACWNRIQQAQLDLAGELDHVAMAAAIDATLSDAIHVDAVSMRRMGVRFAALARALVYEKKGPLTLTPDRVRFEDDARRMLRITYKNVRGKLRPSRNIWGFFVEAPDGTRIPITNARAEGSKVFLTLARSVQPGGCLYYGRGCNPSTNLRDDLFAAPVFGPMEL